MLSIHDPTWYPARHRHMRQAALHAYARAMNPISAIRSRVCRYPDGCFVFPGDPDEQGRCKRMMTTLPYYFHYIGRGPDGLMQCQIDPDCIVRSTSQPGGDIPPTPSCPSGYEKAWGQILLAPPDAWWPSRYHMVCCPKAPSQRVAVSTPRWP
jgi:hypothetical protein